MRMPTITTISALSFAHRYVNYVRVMVGGGSPLLSRRCLLRRRLAVCVCVCVCEPEIARTHCQQVSYRCNNTMAVKKTAKSADTAASALTICLSYFAFVARYSYALYGQVRLHSI